MTSSHGQELFKVDSSKQHGRLFLPESMVLQAEEYARQKNEEACTHETAEEAKKLGMTIDQYREQIGALPNSTKAKEYDTRVKEQREQQEEDTAVRIGSHTLDDDFLASFKGLDPSKSVSDMVPKHQIQEQRLLERFKKESQVKKQQSMEEKFEVIA